MLRKQPPANLALERSAHGCRVSAAAERQVVSRTPGVPLSQWNVFGSTSTRRCWVAVSTRSSRRGRMPSFETYEEIYNRIRAVAMVRRIRDRQAKRLAGKTPQEVTAFYRAAGDAAMQEPSIGRTRADRKPANELNELNLVL